MDHLCDNLPGVELDLIELKITRFDFAEVEKIVEQRHHRAGAFPQNIDELLLFLVERRAHRQQLRRADHGVHGRANFVAHIGEEIALREIGSLRLLLQKAQAILQLLLLGDVGVYAKHSDCLAFGIAKRHAP